MDHATFTIVGDGAMGTVCAILLGLSQIIFVLNFAYSLFWGPKAARNPWHANTLEWGTPSPPGHGNFEKTPIVVRGPYEYSDPAHAEDWAPQAPNLAEIEPATRPPVHA